MGLGFGMIRAGEAAMGLRARMAASVLDENRRKQLGIIRSTVLGRGVSICLSRLYTEAHAANARLAGICTAGSTVYFEQTKSLAANSLFEGVGHVASRW